ncbi:hypothetical protein V6N13_141124 [Hibiscus sabdariffa]
MGCIAGSAMELDIADAVPGKVTDLKPDENYGRMLILFIAYDCFQNLFIDLSLKSLPLDEKAWYCQAEV